MLELSSEETVDDKVEGGVHRDEEVADMVILLVRRTLVRVSVIDVDVVQNLVDGRRRLTHGEHDNDDDHDERDVVLVVAGPRRHRLAAALSHLEVVHQVDVEEDEDEEGEEEDEEAVGHVLVEDVVQVYGGQPHVIRHHIPRCHVVLIDGCHVMCQGAILEEARDVVDAHGAGHHHDLQLDIVLRAESRSVQRATDREVTVPGN